jgi:hypothetical protein
MFKIYSMSETTQTHPEVFRKTDERVISIWVEPRSLIENDNETHSHSQSMYSVWKGCIQIRSLKETNNSMKPQKTLARIEFSIPFENYSAPKKTQNSLMC